MEKPKFQVITLTVTAANQQVKIDDTTKLQHKHVTGVVFTVSDDKATRASEIELYVDGEEILPEGFEIALLTKQETLSLGEAAHTFKERANNSTIKGEYRDSGAAGISYPYKVKIYLLTTEDKDVKA